MFSIAWLTKVRREAIRLKSAVTILHRARSRSAHLAVGWGVIGLRLVTLLGRIVVWWVHPSALLRIVESGISGL